MPSTLVLNAVRNIRPALSTLIDNNTDVLLGFSLRIAEDVLAQLQLQGKETSLNIQPTLPLKKAATSPWQRIWTAPTASGRVRVNGKGYRWSRKSRRHKQLVHRPRMGQSRRSRCLQRPNGRHLSRITDHNLPNNLGVLPFKRRLERL